MHRTYSVLYKFHGEPDGAYPSAMIQDAMGTLYGTTDGGGAYSGGTIFRVSKTGETVLYSFCPGGPQCMDGAGPNAGLIQDASGNLYGTTRSGGSGTGCGSNGCGVVFKLDTTGKETVLYLGLNNGTTAGTLQLLAKSSAAVINGVHIQPGSSCGKQFRAFQLQSQERAFFNCSRTCGLTRCQAVNANFRHYLFVLLA